MFVLSIYKWMELNWEIRSFPKVHTDDSSHEIQSLLEVVLQCELTIPVIRQIIGWDECWGEKQLNLLKGWKGSHEVKYTQVKVNFSLSSVSCSGFCLSSSSLSGLKSGTEKHWWDRTLSDHDGFIHRRQWDAESSCLKKSLRGWPAFCPGKTFGASAPSFVGLLSMALQGARATRMAVHTKEGAYLLQFWIESEQPRQDGLQSYGAPSRWDPREPRWHGHLGGLSTCEQLRATAQDRPL